MRSLILLIFLGAAIAFVLLITGCGGGGDAPESTYQPVNCGKPGART